MRYGETFLNQYWLCILWMQRDIRHHQFGEGEYGQSELIIQQLSAEAVELVAAVATGFSGWSWC